MHFLTSEMNRRSVFSIGFYDRFIGAKFFLYFSLKIFGTWTKIWFGATSCGIGAGLNSGITIPIKFNAIPVKFCKYYGRDK